MKFEVLHNDLYTAVCWPHSTTGSRISKYMYKIDSFLLERISGFIYLTYLELFVVKWRTKLLDYDVFD